MFKKVIWICGLATIILSSYQLIKSDFQLMPYTQLIMGTMLLFVAIEEFQKQRKEIGYMLILTATFVFIVAIKILVL